MTFSDSDLETAVARTGHERFRWLVSDDNPDSESREGYRRIVGEIASGEWPPPASAPAVPAEYPSLAVQAGSAVRALGRFVASGFATVDQAEHDRRRKVCSTCPHFDADAERCRLCGCSLAIKPWSKAETCPDGRW